MESLPNPKFGSTLGIVKAKDQAEFRQAVARFGNPYRFMELEEDEFHQSSTVEQKRAYLRKLEDPYAYHGIFDTEDGDGQPRLEGKLRACLDEVLDTYKPYIARSEWKKVTDYKPEFLSNVERNPARAAAILDKLEQLKFSLMPGEKVEFNRAPAERIIGELKKLLFC
jgi:hypothetical protein